MPTPLKINVLDKPYLAQAGGGFDNSASFQAAVDALSALLPPGTLTKGIVLIPADLNSYNVNLPVFVDNDNIEIHGEGWGTRITSQIQQPAFIFGVARKQKVDAAGTLSDLNGDASFRPDLFGKLDGSVVISPNTRWGFRTNGVTIAQFHASPLSCGVASVAGLSYSDNWTETSQLTVEFCVEPPDGQLFPAGCYLLGLGQLPDEPTPFGIGIGDNNRLFVPFKTSDLDSGPFAGTRGFWLDLNPFKPPYRIAIQFDLDHAVCSAFINDLQVGFVEQSNLTPTSPHPFVPGLKFIINDHYPFMIGGTGLAGSYGNPTGLDLRVYGLRLSNAIRYANNGPGTTQVRLDSPSVAVSDAWSYFGQDAHTICFLPFTDNPATSGRFITVQHNNTWVNVWPGTTMGLIMHVNQVQASYGQNAIRNISVQGANAYGQVISVGAVFTFTVENVRALGGYHGIGSFPIGSSYYIFLTGNNQLSGSDSGYFGAIQLIVQDGRLEFPTSGRIPMRFVGCDANIRNFFINGPVPGVTEGFFKARSYGYGGNYKVENGVIDYEGYVITGAGFYCEAHQQAAATSLVLEEIFMGTVGGGASLVRLLDFSRESENLAPCWFSMSNMQVQSDQYLATVDLDGPLWHGEVKGGALYGPPIKHRQRWGTESNVVVHETKYKAPPHQFSWHAGSHRLAVKSPAPGQFSEWVCVVSGTYGTANPPQWQGLNPLSFSANQLAVYITNHAYVTAVLSPGK